mmetsp:Transcript_89444/g.239204  ORF Transcript_89444/g.239204 Transcript_89444/m.239204 type:complete len:94 (-) Transcript_89444:135-416(-)
MKRSTVGKGGKRQRSKGAEHENCDCPQFCTCFYVKWVQVHTSPTPNADSRLRRDPQIVKIQLSPQILANNIMHFAQARNKLSSRLQPDYSVRN